MAQQDLQIYTAWLELLEWMQDYAKRYGIRFDKESDFTGYIYRMERDYTLPTTVQSVSLGLENGKPVFLASVSPVHEPLKHISLRLLGGARHWHLHEHNGQLFEGKRIFDRAKLEALLDKIFVAQRAA
ncbi:MAG: NADH-quinone oxidoreductase subunit 15 [Deinococcales bacterium]